MNKIQADWDPAAVQAQFNKIKQDLQLLKPLLQQIHRIRALILDTFASNLNPDLGKNDKVKNPVAQGGQVITDIEIIKHQHDIELETEDPDQERAARWEHVFEDLYTIPFEYADDILSADKELIQTLNFHADLLSLSEWQGHDSVEMYKEWAETIIGDWRLWVNGGKVPSKCPFSEGSSTLKVVSWLRGSWWEGVSIGARNLPFSDWLIDIDCVVIVWIYLLWEFIVTPWKSHLTFWPVFK